MKSMGKAGGTEEVTSGLQSRVARGKGCRINHRSCEIMVGIRDGVVWGKERMKETKEGDLGGCEIVVVVWEPYHLG